jgi:bisphosphoglycerate-independent phosphoglycerate mutase (AlkP superfamily)
MEKGEKIQLDKLADWQKKDHEVLEDILKSSDKYIRVDEEPSYVFFNMMADFAETIQNKTLQRELDIALDGRGAAKRFNFVLYNYPEERKSWIQFKDEKMKELAVNWLNNLGIEPY